MHDRPAISFPPCILTNHGRRRIAQRNLTVDLLIEAECFGRHGRYQPGGADLWRVDRGVVRALQRKMPSIAHLLGVTVLNGSDGVCITAYRNRNCKRLLRKPMRPGRGRGAHRKEAMA
jgi:hypothetical protein